MSFCFQKLRRTNCQCCPKTNTFLFQNVLRKMSEHLGPKSLLLFEYHLSCPVDLSRLLLEEDPWKEHGLKGPSYILYVLQVVVLETLMQSRLLAAPLRYILNKLLQLNIFLVQKWSDLIVWICNEEGQWMVRARLEAFFNIHQKILQ